MNDMLSKLQQMQGQMDQVKAGLKDIEVEAEAGNGMVKVKANAAGQLVSVNISKALVTEGDTEQIEDLVLVAVNRAMEKAKKEEEDKLKGAAGSMLSGFPGM